MFSLIGEVMRVLNEIPGRTAAYFYIIILSVSTIYVDYLGDIFNVYSLLFFSTLIACVFFNISNFGDIKKSHASIIRSPILWALTSFMILVAWTASYYVTVHASPRFCLTVSFLSVGLAASLVKKSILKSFLCVIAIFLCYWFSVEASVTTLILAISGGLSIYLYARYSYRFSKNEGLSAINVLSIRFYPLLIFSFIFAIVEGDGTLLLPNYSDLNIWLAVFYLMTLGLFNRAFPMCFSQVAIHKLGAEASSFIFSLIPITTFILQGIFEKEFSWLLFLSTLIASVALNIDRIKFGSKLRGAP